MDNRNFPITQIEQYLSCIDSFLVIYYYMSTEQILRKPANETFLEEQEAQVEHKSSQKVDINILLEKVRAEKKKEKKENLIFLSLISSVILITAFIASF